MSVRFLELWRNDAVRIIDELLMQVDLKHTDLLLDLRHELKSACDLTAVLDLFLQCRRQMELDHYLPFYRLRRLLAHSLRLHFADTSTCATPSLRALLRKPFKSFSELSREIHRRQFEFSEPCVDVPLLTLAAVEHSSGSTPTT